MDHQWILSLTVYFCSHMALVILRPATMNYCQMTSVGRFSLQSETEGNRSIPTFFLALSGEKKEASKGGNSGPATDAAMLKFSPRKKFTASDFEDAWMRSDMPGRHPRFHSRVCPLTRGHFEETHRVHPGPTGEMEEQEDGASLEIKAELDRHVSETMHFSAYRDDLRNRLEHMLMSPLEVSDKLWEVKISNGPLGSSGAISRAKVDKIVEADRRKLLRRSASGEDKGDSVKAPVIRRRTTKGGPWKEAAKEVESVPSESVLLFRSHHALADGASIMAAISDLCDEAEEIRANVEAELRKRAGGRNEGQSVLLRWLSRLARLLKICLWFSLGSLKAIVHLGYLQLVTRQNPFDAVREDAERKGLAIPGRSISWCDAAPLAEAKRIARIIGKDRGVGITVNDLFVSCVTAAVTRQLIEHEEFMAPMAAHMRKFVAPYVNVVVPVHLRGGVVLPDESVGNNIGAFVARCPGEMKHDAVGGGTASAERLQRVHRSLLKSKRSPAPFLSHKMAKFCSDYLPEGWTKAIFERANANACVVVSNVRGYDKKLHLNGMAVESSAGFLPLPPGIPVGVVVQSYAGAISLSVAAEKFAVPDADKFLRWVLDEYQRLREEASELERKRRGSGF
ncbi:hypothetical protein ACHAWF_003983 [Thalassiosira exigua]